MQRLTIRPRPRRTRGLAPLWAATIICMAAAAMPARAQWQRSFGAPSTTEIGAAVAQTADGGFIVAGSADESGGSYQHAYVVKTDASGNTIWDRKYYFTASPNEGFNDVKVCANGDYILAGQVYTSSTTASLLAMRIDGNGNIRWVREIGDNVLDYQGNSVVEATLGDGITTNNGDVVIGGTAYDYPNNTSHGFIVRLTADGNMIWNQSYDAGDPYITTRIFSITETQLTSPGDIAAAGDAYSTTTGSDAMILRVDGNSGAIGASPQGMAMFDLPGGGDYAFSIIERRNGPFVGDLVTAGTSTAVRALGNYTLLVMESRPDPADGAGLRGSNLVGDYYSSGYQGMCVREITDPVIGNVGDVVVGGFAYSSHILHERGFLQKFSAVSLATTSTINAYGAGSGRYSGTGITECTSALGAPGFAMTGSLNAHLPSTDYDLWLLRTDASLGTCQPDGWPIIQLLPAIDIQRPGPITNTMDFRILCGVQNLPTDWGNDICSLEGAPEKAPVPSGSSSDDALSRLDIHPNILPRGASFVVACAPAAARGELVVSDIAGHEVRRQRLDKGAGASALTIDTDGWTPGTYLLSVTLDGTVSTGRVTITAR